jgi:hypothetical protein
LFAVLGHRIEGIENHDVRLANTFKANYDKTETSPVWQNPGIAVIWFEVLLLFLWPFLLHIKGKQVVRALHLSKNKHKVPFFWAVAVLSPVFNTYMTGKLVIIGCHPTREYDVVVKNAEAITVGLSYMNVSLVIAAVQHSKFVLIPIPRCFNMFHMCLGGRMDRILMTVSLYSVYYSVGCLYLCIPFQVLLLCANPHLHAFTILTVWCVMAGCVVLASILFTIDQVFITNVDFRIKPKRAMHQILLLFLIVLVLLGFGSLTFSIRLVLHLTKYGEENQSISKSWNFLLKHVVLPLVVWMAKAMLERIKSAGNRMFGD